MEFLKLIVIPPLSLSNILENRPLFTCRLFMLFPIKINSGPNAKTCQLSGLCIILPPSLARCYDRMEIIKKRGGQGKRIGLGRGGK